MKNIQHALVALDLTKMDISLLNYTNFISNILELKKISLVHIIPNLAYPGNKKPGGPEVLETVHSIDEKVKEKLYAQKDLVFKTKSSDLEIDIEVVEGRSYQKLLSLTELREISLLIIGNKDQSQGSGITARRIAHHATCNILLVPNQPNLSPKKILIPIDYSINSARALETAIAFKGFIPEIQLVPLHVIHLLPSDYYFGLDKNISFRKSFLEESKKTYENYLVENNINGENLEPVFLEDDLGNAARVIQNYASEENFDLVIMGAQGHSTFRNFLLGSTTERFVNRFSTAPVLLIR